MFVPLMPNKSLELTSPRAGSRVSLAQLSRLAGRKRTYSE